VNARSAFIRGGVSDLRSKSREPHRAGDAPSAKARSAFVLGECAQRIRPWRRQRSWRFSRR
jgi:hypothetical protein